MSSIVNKIEDKVAGTSTPSGQHLAAISPSKGSTLEVTNRPTPTPGPNKLLIEVKSIALNPIDFYQRDYGFPPITHYPAVLGSDIACTVISAGSSVASDAPNPARASLPSRPVFSCKAPPTTPPCRRACLCPP
jgi:D-arabinose 1-dehydrogenase-like Zn-dependent alcohol dehydrogenase